MTPFRLVVVGFGLVLASQAEAQNFSNTIFFGDSNSDSGRYLYLPVVKANPNSKAAVGAFTTNPGPEWSVALGSHFGIAVTPSSAPGGGNNYAAGGARVVYEDPARNQWSTASQIAAYLVANGGRADPNALYVYWVGVNDLKTGTDAGFGSPGDIVNPRDTAAITTLGQQAAAQVASLAAGGARYIVVPNTIAISSQEAGVASGFGFSATTAGSRLLYDSVVWSALGSGAIPFIPADINVIYNYVLLNPAKFGIVNTNINTPACGLNLASINCGPANYVVPNADHTYFYADGPANFNTSGHVTSAVQQIEADYIYSLIVAPSQISFLAEVPIKTRAAVVNSIFNQIPLSWGQAGSFHGWVTGDVSSLKINNYHGFPDDPGSPVAMTAGFDYRIARNWLVGAAFSGGTTKQSYSLGGGFKQDELAVSLYSAFRSNSFWFNAVGTWGSLRDSVNRDIPLGITVQSNAGSTRGTNFSFAFETGYDFTLGSAPVAHSGLVVKAPPMTAPVFVHGPVVGITLQQVRVDAYTEVNPAGITALSFGGQRRDSAVTALGYQAYVTLGMWQPYAKVVWNHELADLDRLVTASLTTISAPSYSLPAVVLGRDWGIATLGTRVKLASNVSAYAAFIGQIGQANVVTYGGQVGFSAAFDWDTVVTKY